MTPSRAALLGFVCALPFFFLNLLVVFQATTPGQVVLFVSLLLMFIGGIIALVPMFKKGVGGSRSFYFLNAIIAICLLLVSLTLLYGFGEELYRCGILNLPNCG